MVGYKRHNINISKAAAKRLLMGESINIKHMHLKEGPVPILLLRRHLLGMQKVARQGKGMYSLKISKAHARDLGEKFGEGFWGDLWSGIKKVGKTIAKVASHPITKAAVKEITQIKPVAKKIDQLASVANNVAPGLKLGDIAKAGLKSYTGSGMKVRPAVMRPRMPKASGSGLWGSVGSLLDELF